MTTRLSLVLALVLATTTFGQVQVTRPGSVRTPSANVGPAPRTAMPVATNAVAVAPATGELQFWVALNVPPLARAIADARAAGRPLTRDEVLAHAARIRAQQDAVAASLAGMGARRLASVHVAFNGLAVALDAARLPEAAAIPGVRFIAPVVNAETHQSTPTDLKEVVPYIGATDLRTAGLTGAGVRVAVLDSGIDYTHANFGGPGDAAGYEAAYGTSRADARNKTVTPGVFPTAKVVGGFDFVGEEWDSATVLTLTPDANPIASPGAAAALGATYGTDGSHGTSVADIIAGVPSTGSATNHGVAPGALLYAVKVCSARNSSCSGIAILQGFDYALDPDGDLDPSDAVDIINVSLGSAYGQAENPSAEAIANADALGVVVVCSAGNSGDVPYIAGQPSSAPQAISVAQTAMPSEFAPVLSYTRAATTTVRNTNTVPWVTNFNITGEVVDGGLACPTDVVPPTVSGRIAVIARGNCSISEKVDAAARAGAIAVIITDNVAAATPPSFSFGGPDPFLGVPTIIITQADGTALRTQIAAGVTTATLTFTGGGVTALAATPTSTSSRGPSIAFQTIKPEIAAPGASLAAVSGSFTGVAAFGGTSGAAPVVAGSAALLLEAFPGITPTEVKTRLMNNAFTGTMLPATINPPGTPAPVTRTGAGEVRALRAVEAGALAWVPGRNGAPPSAALSFGYHRLLATTTLTQTVRVRNTTATAKTFTVAHAFRPTAPTAAVTVGVPAAVVVPANGTADFNVTLTINPATLAAWPIVNAGSSVTSGLASGSLFTTVEYAGFITLTDTAPTAPDDGVLTLPFHVIPHRASAVLVAPASLSGVTSTTPVVFTNAGGPASALVSGTFALLGVSPRIPAWMHPVLGANFQAFDLQAVGVRSAVSGSTPVLQFVFVTYDRRTHPVVPVEFSAFLDVNNDGVDDFQVFNSLSTTLGVSLTAVRTLATGTVASAGFSTSGEPNSQVTILTVPYTNLGNAAVGSFTGTTNVRVRFQTRSNLHAFFTDSVTGPLTNGMFSFRPSLYRYTTSASSFTLAPATSGLVNITPTVGGTTAAPHQIGLLFTVANGRSRGEAIILPITGGL